jgi:hypothetical protein
MNHEPRVAHLGGGWAKNKEAAEKRGTIIERIAGSLESARPAYPRSEKTAHLGGDSTWVVNLRIHIEKRDRDPEELGIDLEAPARD